MDWERVAAWLRYCCATHTTREGDDGERIHRGCTGGRDGRWQRRGVLLRRLDDRFPRAIAVSAVEAAIAGGRVHAVARKLPRGRPTTLLSLAGNAAAVAAVEALRG